MSLPISKELLVALLSPHGLERQAAEHALTQFSVSQRVSGFMTILQQQLDASLLQLAAVLLRRDIIRIANPSELHPLVEPLLRIWEQQTTYEAGQRASNNTISSSIAYCLAEVVACLEFTDETVSTQATRRILLPSQWSFPEAAMTLWIAVAQRAPKALARSGKIHEIIQQLHHLSQSQQSLLKLKLTVLAAIAVEDDLSLCQQLATHGLLPWIHASSLIPGEQPPAVWELFVQAAEEAPALLAPDRTVLVAVWQFCRNAAMLGAVQTIATLLQTPHVQAWIREEYHENAGVLLRTVFQGNSNVLEICWRFMVGSGEDWDEQEWAQEPAALHEDGVEDGDEDADCAEALLRDLIHSQPIVCMQVLLPVVEQGLLLSDHTDPRVPRAALATLQCLAEAAPASFEPHLPVAIQAALTWAQRQQNHPRVTYQAVRLIGVLCEVAPSIRKPFVAAIWETLARAVSSQVPRIAAMACQAVVAMCRPDARTWEDVDNAVAFQTESMLLPYLEGILRALLAVLLGCDKMVANAGVTIVVKVRAVNAIACLAQVSGDAFAPYYNNVMPTLLACAATSPSTTANYETFQLAGAALEAATMVGQAIGNEHRDLFLLDANTILQQWAMPYLAPGSSRSLPLAFPMDYLLSACARIASVLGDAYTPFVPTVLPRLLERANGDHGSDIEWSEGDLKNLDSNKRDMVDIDNDEGVESMTVSVPGRGVTKITLNTTKIQEKVQACRAVYEHAAALGASFGPYIPSCLDVFLPLIEYKYSAELRATSAQTIAVLFEAACSYGESVGMDTPKAYLPQIMNAIVDRISKEDNGDMEILFALSESLSKVCRVVHQCVSAFGNNVTAHLTDKSVSSIVCSCMESLSSCLERRSEAMLRLLGNDVTGDDERATLNGILKGEENLLTSLVDTVGYILKCFRSDFFPLFESDVAPVLQPYLTSGNDIRATLAAVCLFDDCVEHCGSVGAEKFAPILVEGIVRGLDDNKNGNDPDLMRASIYGISQIARRAPSALSSHLVKDFVERLRLITGKPKDPEQDSVLFENSVSALASLLLFSPFAASGFVKRDDFIPFFLKNLPLREDEDEAKFCHEGLCNLIELGAIDVVKECRELVRVIGEILAFVEDGEHLATSSTCKRLTGVLFQLQNEVPPEILQRSFAALSMDCQTAINVQFHRHAHKFTNVVSP